MPKKETRSETADSTPLAEKLQSTADREAKQGFRGVEVDPTPNEAYTVAGVTSNQPTPETDVESARAVRQQTGVGMSALEAAEREKRGEK